MHNPKPFRSKNTSDIWKRQKEIKIDAYGVKHELK